MEPSKKIPIKTIKDYLKANLLGPQIKKDLGIKNLSKLTDD